MTTPNATPLTSGEDRLVTVCSACWRASCWQGKFYCGEYESAGTCEKTVATLRRLGLEHSSYFAKEPN